MDVRNLKISVIIPLYNARKYLREAVNSVLLQSLKPLELIIVDDGSTDNSIESIEDINFTFPLRIFKQPNAGQSSARNHGARLANGDYLAFLDQDDIWYPNHLEKLAIPFLKNKWRLGWSYSNLDEINEDGQLIHIGFLNCFSTTHPKTCLREMIKEDCFILPSASLILKQAFDEIGGFDERLSGYEDDDLFLRLFLANWRNHYTKQSLSKWRIYSNSSSYSERMIKSKMIYVRKLLELFPDNPKLHKFWSVDFILPRFLPQAISSYLHHCIKLNDVTSCNMLSSQLKEFTKILPKRKRLKLQFIYLLFKSPFVFQFIRKYIYSCLPYPIKRIILKRFTLVIT